MVDMYFVIKLNSIGFSKIESAYFAFYGTVVFLLINSAKEALYVIVALVGDDALGIIVELTLEACDVLLDVSLDTLVNAEIFDNSLVALKELDGVPALALGGQIVNRRLLDVSENVLYSAREGVMRH